MPCSVPHRCHHSPLCRPRRLSHAAQAACALLAWVVSAPAPAQTTCNTATPVPIGSDFVSSNAASAGDGLGGLCVPTGHAVWHSFTATVSGTHSISLCGSAIDSVATLYDGCGGPLLGCDDNTCGDDAVIAFPLIAAHAYRLRVASAGASPGGAYTVRITPPGPSPTNESCGQAAPIQAGITLHASNISAIGSAQSSCGVSDTSDVFFSYTPTFPGLHRVVVCTSAFAPVVSVNTGCLTGQSLGCSVTPGTGGGCATGASLDFTPPTPGQPVVIRVAGGRGSFGPFDITVFGASPNDLCPSAIPLSIGTPYAGATSPVVATESVVACALSGGDVWHRFSPVTTGPYTVSACGSGFDTVLSIHTACPGTVGAKVLACNDDDADACGGGGFAGASRVTANMAAGGTYWVRLAGKGSPFAYGAYTVRVDAQRPANDDCTSPTTLLENFPYTFSTFGATGTDLTPACGTGDTADAWFAFTPDRNATYEFNSCGSEFENTIALFTSCAGAPFACASSSPGFCGVGSHGAALSVALSAGVPSLVRIAGLSQDQGVLNLRVTRIAPTNNACGPSLILSLDLPIAGTLTGATGSGFAACSAPDGPDLWYLFAPTQSRYYAFTLCGSALDGLLAIYPDCKGMGVIACSAAGPGCAQDGRARVVAFLSAGGAYRVRVLQQAGGGGGVPATGGAFILTATAIAPPNDECSAPVPLAPNVAQFGASIGATSALSPPAPCVAAGPDVWFSFAPPVSGTYQFSTCPPSPLPAPSFDTTVGVYTSCGAGVAPIACNNDDAGACGGIGPSRVVTRLDAGQTYLVRVAGSTAQATGWFWITASAARPDNDACANATLVGEGTVPFDTLAATTDPVFLDSSCVAFNLITGDVWFRFVAPRTGQEVFSVCGAGFDTAMAVSLVPVGGPMCSVEAYPVLACNDDASCAQGNPNTVPQSRVEVPIMAGRTYLVRIGSRFGAAGSGSLRVQPSVLCPCDWNRNGFLSVQDLLEYLPAFLAGHGDFNGSGTTTVQDLFDYLGCFLARPSGCV